MSDLPRGVERTEDPGGRPAVRVRGDGGTALVALCGAQVLHFHDANGDDVLWTASRPEYLPHKPVRGGVPLVFPWFGDDPAKAGRPAHGFARTLDWRVAAAGPSSVTLAVEHDAATLATWPHRFRLQLTVAVTDALRLTLRTDNQGDGPLRCEQALHTYFAVGDVRTASVHGLEHVPCTEQAAEPERGHDAGQPLRFRAETDRIFHGSPDRIELRAPALRRRVELRSEGARSAIVWNPWPAKAQRLPQLAGDDWQGFCCIETANVREHALSVPAGGSHTLSLTVAASIV